MDEYCSQLRLGFDIVMSTLIVTESDLLDDLDQLFGMGGVYIGII
jgi:hypothetical protein